MSKQRIIGMAIGILALLSIAAVADVHQWQLPVGYFNAGVEQIHFSQSGSITAAGKIAADGGSSVHGGIITDTLTATGTGTDVVLAGGAMAYGADPVPAVSQYSGALAVNIGLTDKWGTSTLLDGGKLVTFTAPFTYQDGGPPLCTCSTLGAAPAGVSCDAIAAGTGLNASGAANSVASFVFHCVGPQ